MVIDRVGNDNFELAENPLWMESSNSFFWVDIEKGNLYKYNLDEKKVKCILSTQYRIGAFVFNCNDEIILLTEKGLIKVLNENNKYFLDSNFLIEYPLIDQRFNDAICDSRGRIIAGIKCDDNSDKGRLVVFEKNKDPRIIQQGLHISNGMGFSSDESVFYHTDSENKTIYKYKYNIELGNISDRQIFFINKGEGVPDGMTVDNDNNIYTCIWGEGKVLKILNNGGKINNVIQLPCKYSSSLTFGGKNLNMLLLTSANIACEQGEQTNFDGAIYLLDCLDFGKNEYKAKI